VPVDADGRPATHGGGEPFAAVRAKPARLVVLGDEPVKEFGVGPLEPVGIFFLVLAWPRRERREAALAEYQVDV